MTITGLPVEYTPPDMPCKVEADVKEFPSILFEKAQELMWVVFLNQHLRVHPRAKQNPGINIYIYINKKKHGIV